MRRLADPRTHSLGCRPQQATRATKSDPLIGGKRTAKTSAAALCGPACREQARTNPSLSAAFAPDRGSGGSEPAIFHRGEGTGWLLMRFSAPLRSFCGPESRAHSREEGRSGRAASESRSPPPAASHRGDSPDRRRSLSELAIDGDAAGSSVELWLVVEVSHDVDEHGRVLVRARPQRPSLAEVCER